MNKVWFVTGASSGIGTGVVRAALEKARLEEEDTHNDLSSSTDGSF